ncbi:hypothetical protein MJA45_14785 [Paenibacillus aurantius]|uniref:Uncharacterized protein n=1 Tax=Paenibacillus aurantius TaxID=2918900 RepID=A0AA96LAR2_9BACL|nr:hypothetical protein [Paenibacillus aurantius]WNQ08915.1 hypothetical protein MJA45_14785 [Paenibacillus aurantius]
MILRLVLLIALSFQFMLFSTRPILSLYASVLGVRLATNRLSQFIAPLVFGLIGSTAGVVSIFLASGAFPNSPTVHRTAASFGGIDGE